MVEEIIIINKHKDPWRRINRYMCIQNIQENLMIISNIEKWIFNY